MKTGWGDGCARAANRSSAVGASRRLLALASFHTFEVGSGGHVGRAPRRQLADTLPIPASGVAVTLQASDIAALEQRRRGIRRQRERPLDIGKRWVQPIASAIGRRPID